MRKDSVMRRTNKKFSKLADEKKGVILVTIIFIVAMALLFITTALTISISSRQRVYANAKNDQARLTVTSLAQSIWQAIYSQQIRDRDLIALAQAGSVVRFNNSDIPGMVTGSAATTTAYFYTISTGLDGTPNKIGIECKCDIDGEVQYYRLVLKKNVGEGVPSPMFNLTVDIGNGGLLNSCNFGLDASAITDNDRHNQTRYDATDNVMFIHGDTRSDQDGSGFYTTLLCDGVVYLRDAVFAYNAYFIGDGAGVQMTSTPQFNGASSGATADLYFWGTRVPIHDPSSTRTTPVPLDATSGGSVGTIRFGGIRNLYFDIYDHGASATPRYTGFDLNTTNFNNHFASGGIYFENGSMSSASYDHTDSYFHQESAGTDHCAGIESYLTVDPNEIDTTGEVVDHFVTPYYSSATELDTTVDTINAGIYKISSATTIDHLITCNVSGGDIYIFCDATLTIKRPDSGPGGLQITAANEHNVYIILRSPAKLIIYGGNGGCDSHWCGLYDARCFTGLPTDPANINQTKTPRFYVLSTYTGGEQIQYGDSGGGEYSVLSAMIGLFPSAPGGGNGGTFRVVNPVLSRVFYGRIACGYVDTGSSGGNFNVPYCPTIPGSISLREEAYRDNTDFSVVTEECMFYTA